MTPIDPGISIRNEVKGTKIDDPCGRHEAIATSMERILRSGDSRVEDRSTGRLAREKDVGGS